MQESTTPDWDFLSAELQSLTTTVYAVAARGGCRPDVVLDALGEAVAGGRTTAVVHAELEEPA